MASVSSTRPADVGLKREMGLIGATWSSETSIIGSGWLFGSYFAAVAVGSAVTVAPIECYAVMQYASHYWHSLFNTTTGKITTTGFIATIILMIIFTAIN